MKDESIHTIQIVKTLLKKYGPECLEWEPFVIKKTMFDDFAAAKLNVYKAIAGLSLIENDRFWSDWNTFHFVAQALNNIEPSASTIQEMSIGQLMVAVDTANALREELGSLSFVPVFSEEVAKFIASQALNQGVWFLPAPLHFASPYASKTVLLCKDCGNEEYFVDEEDEVCPVCTGKYDATSLSSFSHNEDRVKLGFGKNTTITTKYPTANVQRILHSLLTTTETKLDENNQDHVCAAKIYTAVTYMMKRRHEANNAYT